MDKLCDLNYNSGDTVFGASYNDPQIPRVRPSKL